MKKFYVYRLKKAASNKIYDQVNSQGWDSFFKSDSLLARHKSLILHCSIDHKSRDNHFKLVSLFIELNLSKDIGYVATVTCNDEEKAFELTNSISKSWVENEQVEMLDGINNEDWILSSSSVGDIFIDEYQVIYVVCNHGFVTFKMSEFI